jgi:exopolysaccharide biosynthesis protein
MNTLLCKTLSTKTYITIAFALLISPAATVWASPITTIPYLGVTRYTDSITLPAPSDQTPGSNLGAHTANINVVQIDLTAPGIGFKLSPDNGAATGETLTQTTLSFLTQENAKLAVNAHFFNFTTNSAVNTTLTGFAASNGTVYSEFEAAPLSNALLPYALTANAPAINISSTNVAQIVNVGASQSTLAGGIIPYNTVSGSDQVITNGVKSLPAVVATVTGPHEIVTKSVPPFGAPALGNWYTDQIAARTALGLSADGKLLFIFTVDAAGGSNGMTVSEEVNYLIGGPYNVYNLINLDGGGSTTLAMEDPVTHVDGIINASSGGPRFVGSSLAVFASPLPEASSFAMIIAAAFALTALGIARRGKASAA